MSAQIVPLLTDSHLAYLPQSGIEPHCNSLTDLPPDRDLIRSQMVRVFGQRMTAVARRFLRCDEDCADAVQDAFLLAFRSLERFEGKSSLGTWLHRIIVNTCLLKLRSRSRRRALPIDDLPPAADKAAWAGSEDHGLSRLTRNETQNMVRACIERLPRHYRTIVLLRDIEELDTTETAQRLGITPGTVKTRLHRARYALRKILQALPIDEANICSN
jgi:RNA polymerase sigma-70 factor (ECF subfamily)